MPHVENGTVEHGKKKVVVNCPPVVVNSQADGLSPELYIKRRQLGSGGFAAVFELERVSDNSRVAAKVVSLSTLTDASKEAKLQNEINLHSQLQHRNVVSYIGSFKDAENVYMLQELCSKTLSEVVKKQRGLPEDQVVQIVSQILGAVEYLHCHDIVHRDLKLSNIFVGPDGLVKLGDLGLACRLTHPGQRRRSLCGTPNYMAPEVVGNSAQGHSFEVDIWALGVILFTMLFGYPPFKGEDIRCTYRRVWAGLYTFPDTVHVSAAAKDLIGLILRSNPEERPTLAEIRQHSFFAASQSPVQLSDLALATAMLDGLDEEADSEALGWLQDRAPSSSGNSLVPSLSMSFIEHPSGPLLHMHSSISGRSSGIYTTPNASQPGRQPSTSKRSNAPNAPRVPVHHAPLSHRTTSTLSTVYPPGYNWQLSGTLADASGEGMSLRSHAAAALAHLHGGHEKPALGRSELLNTTSLDMLLAATEVRAAHSRSSSPPLSYGATLDRGTTPPTHSPSPTGVLSPTDLNVLPRVMPFITTLPPWAESQTSQPNRVPPSPLRPPSGYVYRGPDMPWSSTGGMGSYHSSQEDTASGPDLAHDLAELLREELNHPLGGLPLPAPRVPRSHQLYRPAQPQREYFANLSADNVQPKQKPKPQLKRTGGPVCILSSSNSSIVYSHNGSRSSILTSGTANRYSTTSQSRSGAMYLQPAQQTARQTSLQHLSPIVLLEFDEAVMAHEFRWGKHRVSDGLADASGGATSGPAAGASSGHAVTTGLSSGHVADTEGAGHSSGRGTEAEAADAQLLDSFELGNCCLEPSTGGLPLSTGRIERTSMRNLEHSASCPPDSGGRLELGGRMSEPGCSVSEITMTCLQQSSLSRAHEASSGVADRVGGRPNDTLISQTITQAELLFDLAPGAGLTHTPHAQAHARVLSQALAARHSTSPAPTAAVRPSRPAPQKSHSASWQNHPSHSSYNQPAFSRAPSGGQQHHSAAETNDTMPFSSSSFAVMCNLNADQTPGPTDVFSGSSVESFAGDEADVLNKPCSSAPKDLDAPSDVHAVTRHSRIHSSPSLSKQTSNVSSHGPSSSRGPSDAAVTDASVVPETVSGTGPDSRTDSDTSHANSSVLVVKWLDLSSKYGLGYLLSNGAVGVAFNDHSKILVAPDDSCAIYYPTSHSSPQLLPTHQAPPMHLAKKVKLLQAFYRTLTGEPLRSWMAGSGAPHGVKGVTSTLVPHVSHWAKAAKGIVMCLSSGHVQAMFADGSEVVLRPAQDEVDFLNKQGCKHTYSIRASSTSAKRTSLAKRLSYVHRVVPQYGLVG